MTATPTAPAAPSAPWQRRPRESDWAAAVQALRESEQVLLLAHVAPDADALGSALGVGLALRELGTEVQVSFGDQPFAMPRVLRGLPGQELLVPPDRVRPAVAVASFDVSSKDRLGVLAAAYDAATHRIAVDHHVSYTGFAGISLVDVTAPATAVLALELVDRVGGVLSAPVAATLYAGLLTDTGSFRFAATTSRTHEIAARLLATGIAHDDIARRLYDDEPLQALQVLGLALGRARLLPAAAGGTGLVETHVSRADRDGLALDGLERVVDVLRCTHEAEVAAVLKQDDTGAWRVSLRSKGAVDVSAVARALGGGGHRYAAGYTGTGDLEAVRSGLHAALDPLGAG